jgi:hypothetical protein
MNTLAGERAVVTQQSNSSNFCYYFIEHSLPSRVLGLPVEKEMI